MIAQTIFDFKLDTIKEKLTARSGLALQAEFNHGIGLRDLSNIFLPKSGSNRGFDPATFVAPMVLMLQGGGRSLEDIRIFNEEKDFLKITKNDRLPTASAISHWLDRSGSNQKKQEGLHGLNNIRKELNHRMMKRDSVDEYTLDADATEICADKKEATYTYKKNKGYMPMLGFLFENQLCIYDDFRNGNVSPSADQKGFYIKCKNQMPKGKTIVRFRADSASYNSALINQLEKDNVKWAIAALRNSAIKRAIKSIEEKRWHEPKPNCGFEVAFTAYHIQKTEKEISLVIKREKIKTDDLFKDIPEYEYHVIATNIDLKEMKADEVLAWYNQRGQAENFNKEVKSGFGMERMPCGKTNSNAVFFRLGIIAYNLFVGFKRLVCPDEFSNCVVSTFRWRIFNTAGRIVKHSGKVILRIMGGLEKLILFEQIRENIYKISFCQSR